VIVYVEGPSDKLGMEALLWPLLEERRQAGVGIEFFESPKGDKKISLLTKVPVKAANILLNDPHALVVVLPDLCPRNKGFPHETTGELIDGIMASFRKALSDKGAGDQPTVENRFRVFCFKYDLEALLLAADEPLSRFLGLRSLPRHWRVPVEDQDHERPPRMIVEELFLAHGRRYRDTLHAPPILGRANYLELAGRCKQCFRPFVEFLTQTGPAVQ